MLRKRARRKNYEVRLRCWLDAETSLEFLQTQKMNPPRLIKRFLLMTGCFFLAIGGVASSAYEVGTDELYQGGIIRGAKAKRQLALAFTGHSFAEGGVTILNELAGRKAKASFFFTGDFLVNTNFEPLVRRVIAEGHYLGPHSDKHLLYCAWDNAKKTLVTRDEFGTDLTANLQKIQRFGVKRTKVKFFLPSFEQYNSDITAWSSEMGLTLINFTPGTRSNADYTGEADTNFVSSQAIFDSIVKRERDDLHGLNGFILLLHIGSGPGRADKFHTRFGELLDYLSGKGYQFVRVDELLESKGTP
jgi:peptidoglycan/xylan/chitin deacetylase (PgdA/CDA1 family)